MPGVAIASGPGTPPGVSKLNGAGPAFQGTPMKIVGAAWSVAYWSGFNPRTNLVAVEPSSPASAFLKLTNPPTPSAVGTVEATIRALPSRLTYVAGPPTGMLV